MAVVIAGELVLDRNETAALVRNMAHPDIETLRRRDAFLNDRDDIAFSFSDEGIIAECGSIASLEENQPLYDTQSIASENLTDVSYVQQSLGFDYSSNCWHTHFSSSRKDEGWRDSPQLASSSIARAA